MGLYRVFSAHLFKLGVFVCLVLCWVLLGGALFFLSGNSINKHHSILGSYSGLHKLFSEMIQICV